MPVCPHCGKQIPSDSKYCGECGKRVDFQLVYPPPPPPSPPVQSANREFSTTGGAPIIREPIPDTSRLSGVGIEKFLGLGERIFFRTEGQVWFGNRKRRAYVTDHRIIFYHREPKLMGLIQDDKMDEIYPNLVKRISLVESGLIVKKITLRMDEYEIRGDRGDLIGLYKAIQWVRGQT